MYMNIIWQNFKYSQKLELHFNENIRLTKIYGKKYTAFTTMHWNMDSKYSKTSFHMLFLFNVNMCLYNCKNTGFFVFNFVHSHLKKKT